MNLGNVLNLVVISLGAVVIIDNALADIPSINANSTFQMLRRGAAGALKALLSVETQVAPKVALPGIVQTAQAELTAQDRAAAVAPQA